MLGPFQKFSTSKAIGEISFLQQNCNKNKETQLTLLEIGLARKTDLILIQEPATWLDKEKGTYFSVSHQAYSLFLPSSPHQSPVRPRTAVYFLNGSSLSISPLLLPDNDLLLLEVACKDIEPFLLLNLYNEKQLNPDSASNKQGLLTTKRPSFTELPLNKPLLLAGDFNLHHTWWNSQATQQEKATASHLTQWLEARNSHLVNKPDIGTFFRSNLQKTSVIDLAFSSNFKSSFCDNWALLSSIGSDHELLSFSMFTGASELFSNPLFNPPFNLSKADWPLFQKSLSPKIASLEPLLSALQEDPLTQHFPFFQENPQKQPFLNSVDSLTTYLTQAIQEAAEAAIPFSRACERSKPWWTPELLEKRKILGKKHKQRKKNPTKQSETAYQTARNSYFSAIRTAKSSHWNTFLEHAKGKEIFTAFNYTKERSLKKIPPLQDSNQQCTAIFEEQASILRTALFPQPPSSDPPSWTQYPPSPSPWDWPPLTPQEVAKSLFKNTKKTAPGEDKLSFSILQQAFPANKDFFFRFFSLLFNIGYHPRPWKKALGVVIPKNNKRDYSAPRAYRVISLLNCLGKTLERILAARLSYLGNLPPQVASLPLQETPLFQQEGPSSPTSPTQQEDPLTLQETPLIPPSLGPKPLLPPLLDPSQLGGRKQHSAIDAGLLLLDFIAKNRNLSRRKKIKLKGNNTVSVLLLDIRGAFDHISRNQLLKICQKLALPVPLCSWISSFLSDRTLQLTFNGKTEEEAPLNTGAPQGSPISPILFLLYLHHLTSQKLPETTQFSYLDDFSLATASPSPEKNCVILEAAAKTLFDLAKDNFIEFDYSKTELIHFSPARSPPQASVHLFNQLIKPKPVVKWLGFFLDSHLSFKHHVNKKVQAAEQALYLVKRLGSTQRGLSLHALRQLYLACITPIADYGAPLWFRTSKARKALLAKFQTLQNKALRLILGAFKTSPSRAMELEAAIPPPAIRLQKLNDNYALRVLKLQETHLVKTSLFSYLQETADELAESEPLDNSSLSQLPSTPTRQTLAGVPSLPPSQLLHLVRDCLPLPTRQTKTEEIKACWTKPWEPPIPATFSLPQGTPLAEQEQGLPLTTKESIIRNHQTLILDQNTPLQQHQTAIYYTDGSQAEQQNSCAFCQLGPDNTTLIERFWNLGPGLEVMDSELLAIHQALLQAVQDPLPTTIFTDNLSALQRIQKNTLSGSQNLVNQIKNLCFSLPSVHFCWVPSHAGIYGNEIADKLAKKGLKTPKSSHLSFTSLTHIAREQKARRKALWQDIWQKEKAGKTYLSIRKETPPFSFSLPKNLFPTPLPTRSLTSTFFQLLFGAGFFRSFSFTIKKDPEGLCFGSCTAKQTPQHLILYCPKYRAERKKMQEELRTPLNLTLLFTTPHGRTALLSFIHSTKIATPGWLLASGS
jgi:hypothetical protein